MYKNFRDDSVAARYSQRGRGYILQYPAKIRAKRTYCTYIIVVFRKLVRVRAACMM